MHLLLDGDVLQEIHTGTYTDLELKTEPFLVHHVGRSAQVQVKVRVPNGRKVGELKTHFKLDSSEMQVRYQFVEIDAAVRGHGFGREFFTTLELEIRERRGDVITLHTWRTGNFLFAKLGFDFNLHGTTEAALLLARQTYTREVVEEALDRGRITQAEFDQIDPVLVDLSNPTPSALSRPSELSDLPRDLGWRILSGHQWEGIKWLV